MAKRHRAEVKVLLLLKNLYKTQTGQDWKPEGTAPKKAKEIKQPGPGEYKHAIFTDDGPKYTTRVKPYIDPFKMKTDPGPGQY